MCTYVLLLLSYKVQSSNLLQYRNLVEYRNKRALLLDVCVFLVLSLAVISSLIFILFECTINQCTVSRMQFKLQYLVIHCLCNSLFSC